MPGSCDRRIVGHSAPHPLPGARLLPGTPRAPLHQLLMATAVTAKGGTVRPGVLLCYRLPREPSTPRISVWRKLERLGVARIGDGLVGLPNGNRTREQLEWVADEVTDAGGLATIWLATPGNQQQHQRIAESMTVARAAEYRQIIAEAKAAARSADDLARAQLRLRTALRSIQRRDYFPPPEREQAQTAVATITSSAAATT